ncbi:MAG: P-II family nitrogen regulator [Burkholderiales bacterium]
MREIKAFIHRNRVADVIHGLREAGFRNITVIDVKGTLRALDPKEQDYSIELAELVITEVKLELVVENEAVDRVIDLICERARTGQQESGWVYVSDVLSAVRIGQPSRDSA